MDLSRRAWVAFSTAAVATVSLAGRVVQAAAAEIRRAVTPQDKGHPLSVDAPNKTVVGYADQMTVRPGDTIGFAVSTYAAGPYTAKLVRVINGDGLSPSADRFKVEEVPAPFAGQHRGRQQVTHRGSYVGIEKTSAALDGMKSFSVVALVMPSPGTGGPRYAVSRWDEGRKAGWALGIDERGEAAFWVGDGAGRTLKLRSTRFVNHGHWTMIGGSYDAESGEVRVYDVLLSDPDYPFDGGRVQDPLHYAFGSRRLLKGWSPSQSVALRIAAACGARTGTGAIAPAGAFNGRIDGVRIVGRVIGVEEMATLATAADRPADQSGTVLAWWDFSVGIGGDEVHDASGGGNHGRVVNLPLRAAKGYHWKSSQDWRRDPREFAAIYFHEDDLADSGWEQDFTYTVPAELRSGVYAVHLTHGGSEHFMPFFVAPPRGRPTAKVALILPTTTYLSYQNWDKNYTQIERYPAFHFNVDDHAFLLEHPEFGRSTYDNHVDGTQVVYSSWLRPALTQSLKSYLASLTADTQTIEWLEHVGIDYDVVTDDLLHREGAELLAGYTVVLTGQHPEYSSEPMRNAYDAFLRRGGRLMGMGGNSFTGHAAWHPTLPIIELRRYTKHTSPLIVPGESRQQFDGFDAAAYDPVAYAVRLLGVAFTSNLYFGGNGFYTALPDAKSPRARFIFEGVEHPERLGDFGNHFGGAAGDETDGYAPSAGTPKHALHLAEGKDFPVPAFLRGAAAEAYHHDPRLAAAGEEASRRRASLVFFETPAGGAVFAVGSMAYVGALNHRNFDNDIARLTENVLRRFLDPTPFVMPS